MRRALTFCGRVLRQFSLILFLGGSFVSVSQASDIDVLKNRLQAYYVSSIGSTGAAGFMSSQGQDGSWRDIEYKDTSMGAWKPVVHLDRTLAIAAAYSQPKSELYHSAAASKAVTLGLQRWIDVNPHSDNWWFNTIGPQLKLMPILILMDETLPKDLRSRCISLLQDPQSVPKQNAGGQNLIWYATEQLVRGVLKPDADDISKASNSLQNEVAIVEGEGIQPDFSFHQHSTQLYTGAYGLGFLTDSVRTATWLKDTPWAYSPEKVNLLSDYALSGIRPIVRGKWLDWSARGREFTRAQNPLLLQRGLLPGIQGLVDLMPQSGPMSAFANYLQNSQAGAPWTGNSHFWRSDFMVEQTATGYMSLKMVSNRTAGTESGNGENLLGYWLPFGATYLLRRGDEYDGMPAVWDWSKLPGVTSGSEVPLFQGLQQHSESFVGGVSNGVSGAAAMSLDKLGIRAHKAWFFDGDLMIALGSDIQSGGPSSITTSLNQSRLVTKVTGANGVISAVGSGPQGIKGASWLWQDGFTYLFPKPTDVMLQQGQVKGIGHRINNALGATDESSAPVFSLWIDHGRAPKNEGYAYGVWMGAAKPEDATKYPRFSVVANGSNLQAVRFESSRIVEAAFFQAGDVELDKGVTLAVDHPCLVMVAPRAGGTTVSVSEPTGKYPTISVSIRKAGQPVSKTDIALGQDWMSKGKSVSADLPQL
jgi:chondroitin AC lyase